jgi:phage terminase Nu1 subunit (DNA packaging protein)
MAMTPREYSIHGLAVEFAQHKEIVARKIRDIPPRRTDGKTKYYFISDVAHLIVEGHGTRNGGTMDRREADARRAAAEAQMAEMKLEMQRGDLISISTLENHLEKVFTASRARLLSMPSKLASILSPDNPNWARQQIEDAVLEAMAELASTEIEYDEAEGEPGSASEAEASH